MSDLALNIADMSIIPHSYGIVGEKFISESQGINNENMEHEQEKPIGRWGLMTAFTMLGAGIYFGSARSLDLGYEFLFFSQVMAHGMAGMAGLYNRNLEN